MLSHGSMAFKIFVVVCLFMSLTAGTDESTSSEDLQPLKPKLVIYPQGLRNGNNHYLVRRVEETLNLTCRVESPEGFILPVFNMSWDVPKKAQNSPIRVLKNQSVNALNLIVHQLQPYDEGEYECEAESSDTVIPLKTFVNVIIKKKGSCGDKLFLCNVGSCIPPRYVCDGKRDCSDGKDESLEVCGTDKPCRDKLSCEDGRCIPVSWCCQQLVDNNCTVKNRLQCCHQLNKPYSDHDYVTDQQRFSDMTFLQTTIYTVIGCAMAFMFIVTILVIAICRVHMKRSMMSRYPVPPRGAATVIPPPNIHHHSSLQAEHLPYYDLDLYLNRAALSDTISAPGLLVTYNINNGVQFVGHPIDPPPYCEVIASPPREGPPPPYASREDLGGESEALLPSGTTSPNTSELAAAESEVLLPRGRNQQAHENGTRNVQPSSSSSLVTRRRESVIYVEPQTE